jgi:hypothetical protein
MLAELLELLFMLRYKRERHISTSVNLGLLGKLPTRGRLRTGVKREGRLTTAKASERFNRNREAQIGFSDVSDGTHIC